MRSHKNRFVRNLAIMAILLLTLWISRSFWLSKIGDFLVVDEKIEKSDVIVVLSGIHIENRIESGVKLYHEAWAPKILLAGDMELAKETGINLMKVYAMSLGVPEDDILVETESMWTSENASKVLEIVRKNNYKSFILVTSAAHSRRARFIFKRIIPFDIKWSTFSDREAFQSKRWWKDIRTIREVLYEWLGLLFFLFKKL